ncbi:MAG TPA: polysaccharide biosynthesis tyrosine autokinase [Anaerolineae bacterium]|nr:polysaccharide biosynthesis tyrosine autokinase [Anaerolineae bacterium]
MELRQYLNIVRKWWWLIVISMVIAGGAGYFATKSIPPTYLSRVTLMVGQALQNPNPSQNEIFTGEALAQSYADLVKRQPVLQGTLNALSLNWELTALQQMVSSRVVLGTQLLEITVLDTDPNRAQTLANEIGHQAILLSPSSTDLGEADQRQFILDQLVDLKANIQHALTENAQLDQTITSTGSASQVQAARDRQAVLRTQISSWQNTYAQLLNGLQHNTTNFLSVVEPPQVPTAPIGPRPIENALLAVLIGFVLSTTGTFLLEYMDDTIKTPEDARQVFDLAVLGTVGQMDYGDYPSKLVTALQPRSPISESFRILRTNLQFSAVDQPLGALMVTSTSPSEGKSLTAANLAVVMAQSGKRVILVDADLRRPTQHRIFELNNNAGLTNVLLDGPARLADALQLTPIENLRVLTAGSIPPNPSELVGSARMAEFIQSLRAQADLIIFDTPPIMVVSDATVLSPRVDGVLIVVNSAHTRRPIAQRAENTLKAAGARVLGISLNRLAVRDAGYYYDYYYAERDENKPRRWFSRNGHAAKSASVPVPSEEVVKPKPAAAEKA